MTYAGFQIVLLFVSFAFLSSNRYPSLFPFASSAFKVCVIFRWDIQRLREQHVFEKLRGKEEAAASSTQCEQTMKTFLGSIEDCEFSFFGVIHVLFCFFLVGDILLSH